MTGRNRLECSLWLTLDGEIVMTFFLILYAFINFPSSLQWTWTTINHQYTGKKIRLLKNSIRSIEIFGIPPSPKYASNGIRGNILGLQQPGWKKTWWDKSWRTLILLLVWSRGADGQLTKYRTVVWTHIDCYFSLRLGTVLRSDSLMETCKNLFQPSAEQRSREIVWDRGTETKTQSYG